MMMNQIPEQHDGGKLDTVAKVEFPSISQADEFYQTAKNRLLHVSSWAKICKVPLSTFTLTDHAGNPVKRQAIEGDYLKIDIPGPGPDTGEGFDWVRIEKITEEHTDNSSTVSMQARPTANPGNKEDTAHFFTSAATSTFQVKKIGKVVYAEEHGRNEVPNTDTSQLTDNIRNTLVGWAAKIGLSYPQWKSLVKGILETDPQE